jgi:hypothetical protein
MINTTRTPVAALKAGDIVCFYGGRFQITEDARELQSYRPEAGHLVTAPGPCNGAIANSICIEGQVPGYFEKGTTWTFQGTHAGTHAVAYQVENQDI